jgi:hypothetical protein
MYPDVGYVVRAPVHVLSSKACPLTAAIVVKVGDSSEKNALRLKLPTS